MLSKFEWKTFFVWKIYFFYLLISSGLIVNLLMFLSYLLFWHISVSFYRKILYYLAYSLWSEFTFFAQWWAGCEVFVHLREEDRNFIGKEHCLVLMNHKYDIDWLMGWILTERYSMLGTSKVFVKRSLAWLPIIGWAWKFTETIFLRRQWNHDREIILRDLAGITQYPPGYAVNILLFPEGTRFTAAKLAESNRWAETKGLPSMRHCLHPRCRGFVQAVFGLRSQVAALYDTTVCFESSVVKPQSSGMAAVVEPGPAEPTLWNIINGVPMRAHLYCRRFPIKEIPNEEKECAKWLMDCFHHKDQLYESFVEAGGFGTDGFIPAKRKHDLAVMIVWMVLLTPPLVLGIFVLVYNQFYVPIGLAILAIITANFLMKKMVSVTEIRVGSSYGQRS